MIDTEKGEGHASVKNEGDSRDRRKPAINSLNLTS